MGKVSESTSYLTSYNQRPMQRTKFVHQSQANLEGMNIYTSNAYEQTKKQYNERMSRLRNSAVSNQIEASPKMRKKASKARMYQDEYGAEFELQPRVRGKKLKKFASGRRLNQQALLEKYGSRDNLNIYSRKKFRPKARYTREEYQY